MTRSGGDDVADLVSLAVEEPERAEALATRLLAGDPGPADRSRAQQALGIVRRDRGDLDGAVSAMREAVRSAVRSGDPHLVSDVRATYGLTLVVAARPRAGLRLLDLAVADPSVVNPVTWMRRATALGMLGRHRASYDDMLAALDGFRRTGQPAWEAGTLHNLGYLEMTMGRVEAAEEHTSRAAELFEQAGLELEALWARQNLGEFAYVRGDLPAALRVFDEVTGAYAALGHRRPHLATARCQTLLAAGLVAEAVEVADRELAEPDLIPADVARLQTWGANARLAAGDLDGAAALAAQARDGYRRFGDSWWETQARLVAVRARARAGERGRRLAAEAVHVAETLDAQHADEAPVALIVASRLVEDGRRVGLLDLAAGYRTRSTSLVRASGWLGRALERELAADRGGVLRGCARGLDALDDHRRVLGSTELRALATGHGSELATLALRHAAGDPRALLRWSERWRSTALAQAPVTPGSAPVLESLVALRETVRRLTQARADGEPTDELEGERTRLERQVRAEHHRLAGADEEVERFDVDHLVATVGDGTLVELVDVDGVLHVLVVHRGRVRRYVAGTTADALALADSARFILRRSARGRPYAPGDLGDRLEQVLFGDAAPPLPDGPVVVVPTARLHGVPWAMLPALAGRPFGVVPSAAQWLRARAARPRRGSGVTLLAGPGLGTGGAEVPVLARRLPDALHLSGTDATVEAALAALDGARLAHVAAHGRFRADSPLFSALEMADGPLTVHDLERLKVAPHRMVLSACESGVLAPVGADELLGLASALFALGTAGLVCSVAEVNDAVTAELMVDLHAHLDRGDDPATALLALRLDAEGGPAAATAAAFVSLGV
ncbi:CHAT domain-containing protein [Nocardioides dilutus]